MSRTLTVYLAADLKRFSGPLRNAQNDMGRFQNGMNSLSNAMGPMMTGALLGAAAAAGALALKLGVDGVQAAIEDEAAVAKLATTMQNLGLAQDTSAAEASIDAMQRQYGISDSLLRPSFEKLVRVTHDTTAATSLLATAMDTAQGTGKSLEAVTQAMSRAAQGNATALSRIYPEMDKNIAKSGDMQAITAELARTFGGQAKTASESYQGQLNRLSVGFDELKESFGYGFLGALGDANDGTATLLETMKDVEPEVKSLGDQLGKVTIKGVNFAAGIVKASDAVTKLEEEPSWDNLKRSIDETMTSLDEFVTVSVSWFPTVGPTLSNLYRMGGGWEWLREKIGLATTAVEDFDGDAPGAAPTVDAWALLYENRRDQINANRHASELAADEARKQRAEEQRLLAGSRASVDDLTDSYEFNTETLQSLTGQLGDASRALDDARQKVDDYAAALSSDILSGINIGQAIDAGKQVGISTLEAFNRQIDQANWYGNVLREIKSQGGNEQLLNMLREAGPEQGGAWGQALIDDGLVPTINGKLEQVTKTANETAMAMVPEWGAAGIESATLYVDSTITKLQDERARLAAIGKAMGKPIGANIKAEILTAVSEALTSAEKSKTAAQATKAATQANAAAAASPQVMAITLAQMLTNANNRGGYSMGVPIPSPVLG